MSLASRHAVHSASRKSAMHEDGTIDATIAPEADIGNPEANDFERSQEDTPTDDPGDAQRTSKTEPDGDGEEELR